jgi:hypothetical protein
VLRPRSRDAAAQAAARLGDNDARVPKHVVEGVIAALPPDDVARLVALAAEAAPGRWRSLVEEVGSEHAREPLLVGVATRAVAELQPPPRWLVAMREQTAHAAPGPLNVLATLVQPESVWSIDEVAGAEALASPSVPVAERTRAVFRFAHEQLREDHLERARTVAEPVARILPLAEAPRTTRHLREALELVRGPGAASLCELLLLTYVFRRAGVIPILPSAN